MADTPEDSPKKRWSAVDYKSRKAEREREEANSPPEDKAPPPLEWSPEFKRKWIADQQRVRNAIQQSSNPKPPMPEKIQRGESTRNPDKQDAAKNSKAGIWAHLKGGLHWCAVNLWRWEVVGIGAPLLFGVGVGAMYADQYSLAAAIYFIAIGLAVVKVITYVKTHENRIGIAVVAVILGGAVFGASYGLIEYRRAQVETKSRSEHPAPLLTVAPEEPKQIPLSSPLPTPQASPTMQHRRAKSEQERRDERARKALDLPE